MNEPTITCPSCKSDIKLTESLAGPLVEQTRRQFVEQLNEKDRLVEKVQADIAAEKKRVELERRRMMASSSRATRRPDSEVSATSPRHSRVQL